jgi:hypothetical protein
MIHELHSEQILRRNPQILRVLLIRRISLRHQSLRNIIREATSLVYFLVSHPLLDACLTMLGETPEITYVDLNREYNTAQPWNNFTLYNLRRLQNFPEEFPYPPFPQYRLNQPKLSVTLCYIIVQ